MSKRDKLQQILDEFREDVMLLLREKASLEAALARKEAVIRNLEQCLELTSA